MTEENAVETTETAWQSLEVVYPARFEQMAASIEMELEDARALWKGIWDRKQQERHDFTPEQYLMTCQYEFNADIDNMQGDDSLTEFVCMGLGAGMYRDAGPKKHIDGQKLWNTNEQFMLDTGRVMFVPPHESVTSGYDLRKNDVGKTRVVIGKNQVVQPILSNPYKNLWQVGDEELFGKYGELVPNGATALLKQEPMKPHSWGTHFPLLIISNPDYLDDGEDPIYETITVRCYTPEVVNPANISDDNGKFIAHYIEGECWKAMTLGLEVKVDDDGIKSYSWGFDSWPKPWTNNGDFPANNFELCNETWYGKTIINDEGVEEFIPGRMSHLFINMAQTEQIWAVIGSDKVLKYNIYLVNGMMTKLKTMPNKGGNHNCRLVDNSLRFRNDNVKIRFKSGGASKFIYHGQIRGRIQEGSFVVVPIKMSDWNSSRRKTNANLPVNVMYEILGMAPSNKMGWKRPPPIDPVPIEKLYNKPAEVEETHSVPTAAETSTSKPTTEDFNV